MVEDDFHVLIKYSLYDDLRNDLMTSVATAMYNFVSLNEEEKFNVLCSQDNIVRFSAKTLFFCVQASSGNPI